MFEIPRIQSWAISSYCECFVAIVWLIYAKKFYKYVSSPVPSEFIPYPVTHQIQQPWARCSGSSGQQNRHSSCPGSAYSVGRCIQEVTHKNLIMNCDWYSVKHRRWWKIITSHFEVWFRSDLDPSLRKYQCIGTWTTAGVAWWKVGSKRIKDKDNSTCKCPEAGNISALWSAYGIVRVGDMRSERKTGEDCADTLLTTELRILPEIENHWQISRRVDIIRV